MRNKEEKLGAAFLRGVMIGSAIVNEKLITDYGFGPRGFGFYVYDRNYKVIAFRIDRADDEF